MSTIKKYYVYRGVSQTKEQKEARSSNSHNDSLAKTYRGSQYFSLPKEHHEACSHTYRGTSYTA
jgi:hypothetical protein